MLNLIKKTFIKNYMNTSDAEVRFHYGIFAGIVGILSNIVLFSLKIIVGILSGSISIIADAINNLSDAGSSVVTLLGFKMASRPADDQHPFGHARYEYVAGMIITIIVLIIGVTLFKSGIEKIINPSAVEVKTVTYVVLACAIVIKLLQGLLYKNFGKSINSQTLLASAADSRNDVITTIAVLISTIIIHTTGLNIDGYVGILVSLFIVISSIGMLKEIINPLIGSTPDKEFVDKIAKEVMSFEIVLGFHDLMIHSYGPAICFASMHVEVSEDESFVEAHDEIDNIERAFMRDLNVHMVIHMDPIAAHDTETIELKELVTNAILQRDNNLSIHDFRLVKGNTHTNVLFDVVVPHKSKITAKDIRALLNENIKSDTVYYYVINIDNTYIK
ncbi:MAG: cation diffusion facilitator family transporter [Clostridia bacterium]